MGADLKRVVVTVTDGCAEVIEGPDDVLVVIVDRDGEYPYRCPKCDVSWGTQSWKSASGVQAYTPTSDELDMSDPWLPCPDCKSTEPVRKGEQVSFGELIGRIAAGYESLGGEELAELWNELFPSDPVVYEGDSFFWIEESA